MYVLFFYFIIQYKVLHRILFLFHSTSLLLYLWLISSHFVQGKLAKDSDAQKFEEDDLILKVEECLEARRFKFGYLLLQIIGSLEPAEYRSDLHYCLCRNAWKIGPLDPLVPRSFYPLDWHQRFNFSFLECPCRFWFYTHIYPAVTYSQCYFLPDIGTEFDEK